GRSAGDRASAGPAGPADRPHGVTRNTFRRPPRSTAIPSLGRPPIHSPIRRTSVMRIVVARAPGRVSLAGGGTDLPSYYERHGGAVVSFAISSGATATISERSGALDLVSTAPDVRGLIPPAR